MRTPEQVQEILRCLAQAYPADCSLQYQKDYELLFAVRLAAQCTDERVNQVTPVLYARFPTLEAFAAAEPEDVEPYVHSCGFYRAKARTSSCARASSSRNTAAACRTPWRPSLPCPASGAKTANLILGDVYHKPAVVVDTHWHPALEPDGPRRRAERPCQDRDRTAQDPAAGGIIRLLPPAGAARAPCARRASRCVTSAACATCARWQRRRTHEAHRPHPQRLCHEVRHPAPERRGRQPAGRDRFRAGVSAAVMPCAGWRRSRTSGSSGSFPENVRAGWSPTVRPPRLGGNVRMGVFTTRSPFRPNPIGLSCVRLERIEFSDARGPVAPRRRSRPDGRHADL